eukprot:GHRQ01034690.1.p3 GENE.GHRQ01034690.1~~GHRQ01034690.1.p3  ORF type:complete len:100 (-),score=34.94 GHRQ01034690.1:256-555(-)
MVVWLSLHATATAALRVCELHTRACAACLQVVCPGGLVSIMCYIGHPGGVEEYEQVRALLAGLSPSYWTSSELKLVNRPTAPVMLLLWRRTEMQQQVSR